MDISDKGVESVAGNGVVSAGSKMGGQAVVEDGLANNLGENGHTQDHPRELEAPSKDIEVSSREDESDDGDVGDSGSTWASDCVSDELVGRSRAVHSRGLFHDRSSEKKEW